MPFLFDFCIVVIFSLWRRMESVEMSFHCALLRFGRTFISDVALWS